MNYKLTAAAESAFYDNEAEAIWINFFLAGYSAGKLDFQKLKKINSATERLIKVLAHLGRQVANEDFESDLPTDSGDQMGSVVYFFKHGDMPEEKILEKYANKADAANI